MLLEWSLDNLADANMFLYSSTEPLAHEHNHSVHTVIVPGIASCALSTTALVFYTSHKADMVHVRILLKHNHMLFSA